MRTLVFAGAMLAAAAALAAAQTAQELPSAPVPGWSFTPAVSIGVTHDSNATLRATAGSSEGLGDRLWTVEPSGALDFLSKYTTFDASYHGNIRRYSTLDALNGYDQRAGIGFTHRATKHVTFSLRDSYSRLPTTDELVLPGIVPFSRVGSQTNMLTGGVDAQLSPLTKLTAHYTGTWVRFDEQNNLVLRGANVQGASADLTRQVSRRVSVGGAFEYRIANLDQGLHQFRFQDIGGILQYQAGPHTLLDFGAGLARVVDRADESTNTGPYLHAGVTQQTEHALIGASYQRLYVPSLGFAGSNRSEELRGFARVPLARRLSVDNSVAWRRSDPLLANALKFQSLWLTSALGYDYTRWLRIQGYYRFTRQDTPLAGGIVTRHRAGIEAIFSQPVRIQ